MNSTRAVACLVGLPLTLLGALCAVATADDPAPGSVSVQVLDASGTPAPGLAVAVLPWEPGGAPRSTPLQAHEQYLTDAEGRFPLDARETPSLGFHIWAVHGVECASRQIHPNRETGGEHTVRLAPGRPVYGFVRDSSGVPLEGVQVSYLRNVPLAVTGPDGLFTIPVFLEHGSLCYVKKGYAYRTTHSYTRMEVVMEPGGIIVGTVLDDSGPLADAQVRVNAQPENLELRTDAAGRFRTVGLQPAEQVSISTWRSTEAANWRGEGDTGVVAGETASVTIMTEKTLRAVTPEEEAARREAHAAQFTTISGRVVHAETGSPVQAHLYTVRHAQGDPSGLDYFKRRSGHTLEDGTFLIERVPKNQPGHIMAAPDDPLLYPVEGFVYLEVQETPITELVLTVAPGAAVRGELTTHDGKPVPNGQISLGGQGVHRTFFLKEGTAFSFPNLAPAPYFLSADGVRHQTPALRPGELIDDVILRLPSGEEGILVAGTLRDPQGVPIGGGRISFENRDLRLHDSAETDAAGRFSTRVKEPALYQYKVWETYSLAMPRESASGQGKELPVPEHPGIEIAEPGITALELFAERLPWPPAALGGRIVDTSGAPLEARLNVLTDAHRYHQVRTQQGAFTLSEIPPGPFLLEATLQGYQARVLEAGVDFHRTDRDLTIVLQPGPFPPRMPLWTLVTGRPATEAALREMFLGEEVRRKEDEYRRIAEPQEPAPPDSPPSGLRSLKEVDLLVTDLQGHPVPRLVVLQPELMTHAYPLTQQTARPAHAGATRILTRDDGRYTVPNLSLVETPGSARVLVEVKPEADYQPPLPVLLAPPMDLRIIVRDYHGRPVPEAVAGPIEVMNSGTNYGYPGATPADSAGHIHIDTLPAGAYVYAVSIGRNHDAGSLTGATRAPRLIVAEGAPGEQVVREVVLPLANVNTTAALLVEWEQQGIRPENLAEAVASLSPKDRRAIMGLVTTQLAQLPGLSGGLGEQASFFARLAGALGDAGNSAAPELMRLLRTSPPAVLSEDHRVHSLGRWTASLVEALTQIRGERAKSFFVALARDANAPPESRRAALLVILAEGNSAAIQEFVRLRQAARRAPDAPALKAHYTHAEKMAEAAIYTLSIIPGTPLVQPDLKSAWVDEGFAEGSISCGTYTAKLRRIGEEWIVISAEPIPQVMW